MCRDHVTIGDSSKRNKDCREQSTCLIDQLVCRDHVTTVEPMKRNRDLLREQRTCLTGQLMGRDHVTTDIGYNLILTKVERRSDVVITRLDHRYVQSQHKCTNNI